MTVQVHQQTVPLKLQGKWRRFSEKINYKKPNCNLIIGGKETGKSALNENLATHYVEASPNGIILDFFASRDNEGLGWCRSPYKDSILFVIGDSVDVSSSFDSKHVSKMRLADFGKHKVVISASAFYSNLSEEHHALKYLMDLLWRRTHWTDVWYLLIRETANLIYSRITVGEDQARAKAYMIYVMREARHMGYAVGADAIRFMSIDIDLRSLADYTFFKACGVHGLPKSLKWIYSRFEPFSIMRMPIHRYIILSRRGSLGRGIFEYPLWHKQEKEDLLKQLNIQIDYGEPIDYGDKGYKRVSDFDHEELIMLRAQGDKGSPMGYHRIAELKKRSTHTIYKEVKRHNRNINKLGFCERCRRLKSTWQKTPV